MKRKEYVTPAVETVEREPQQFLATSPLEIFEEEEQQNPDGTFGNASQFFLDFTE